MDITLSARSEELLAKEMGVMDSAGAAAVIEWMLEQHCDANPAPITPEHLRYIRERVTQGVVEAERGELIDDEDVWRMVDAEVFAKGR